MAGRRSFSTWLWSSGSAAPASGQYESRLLASTPHTPAPPRIRALDCVVEVDVRSRLPGSVCPKTAHDYSEYFDCLSAE